MADQHLIVLDLDGTLLRNDKTISDRTKGTLKTLMEQGHHVMIATGRPYRSSAQFYQELALKTPIVNFNGALVHHPHSVNWGSFHTPLDIGIARDIVDACNSYSFHNIIAEIQDDVYLHNQNGHLLDIFNMGNPKITIGDLRSYLPDSPTSLLIHAEPEDVTTIRSHLAEVHAELIDHRRWGDPFHVIEIVKSGMHKAVGIQKVAGYLNIPQSRIIAFGDEDNDLEMLEYANIGVAMGNGISAVKNIANVTTASNEEDGVALFLEDRFNLKKPKIN
ncbi:HAD family phosphatase [Bacillus sp. AGMB 02131]|uniref:HAD family phosphatase n=1 Tax=Peribacillus faecalis TaxID=2772559 RepID=A0A927D3A5_9BACI|nr:Cof-type HAD-IIB family hydrolase [Peribacillus faecalis]MBD3110309.1 HAD family phosphatase [Peribacillus faecalis]